MAINIIPPKIGERIKVTDPTTFKVFEQPNTQSAERQKIGAYKKYIPFEAGDTVEATGNILENTQGTWFEVQAVIWVYNFFKGWYVVGRNGYINLEKGGFTWLSNSVSGSKPTQNGSVGTTTTTTDTTPKEPRQEKEGNNSLAYIGIVLSVFALLTRKN